MNNICRIQPDINAYPARFIDRITLINIGMVGPAVVSYQIRARRITRAFNVVVSCIIGSSEWGQYTPPGRRADFIFSVTRELSPRQPGDG